jgi:hypothetical protein
LHDLAESLPLLSTEGTGRYLLYKNIGNTIIEDAAFDSIGPKYE